MSSKSNHCQQSSAINMTPISDIPCIWPTVNSLSNRSTPRHIIQTTFIVNKVNSLSHICIIHGAIWPSTIHSRLVCLRSKDARLQELFFYNVWPRCGLDLQPSDIIIWSVIFARNCNKVVNLMKFAPWFMRHHANKLLAHHHGHGAGPTLWNSLPEQLRQPDSTFGQFKRSLTTCLVSWAAAPCV